MGELPTIEGTNTQNIVLTERHDDTDAPVVNSVRGSASHFLVDGHECYIVRLEQRSLVNRSDPKHLAQRNLLGHQV